MRLKHIYSIGFFLFLGLITSCSSDKPSVPKDKTYLPIARGEANVILVIMDTADWTSEIGLTLKDIFSEFVPGLPQSEPYFKIRNINPLKLNSVLKSAKNMIYLSTIDNKSSQGRKMMEFFTDKSLKKITEDSSLFMRPQSDMYAKGQEILHLFGQNKNQLLSHLKQNKLRLRNYFLSKENARVAKNIFKVREKGIEKKLAETHGFKFNIPYGYDLAKDLRDFVWVRTIDPDFEKNIFVHYAPYNSKEPFNDVLAFREKITSTYMRDIEKPEIYMTLQGDGNEYQQVKEMSFNDKYSKEARGLWMLNDISSGGPYISYTFVDESQKRLYYLEGYVYAPGGNKRVHMQEIEIILQSFLSGKEII
ncbi:MAG: DUF4837 family protein [Reichenbachiella sp.]